MTPRERHARIWAAAASLGAQVAATTTGMLPLWVLPITIAITLLVSWQTGPVDPKRARLIRALGTAGVAVFAAVIAHKTLTGNYAVIDPRVTLRSLTGALVVLSLVIAPTARSPREHRVWLTVTTGVLVAAAAGARTAVGGGIALGCWAMLLAAITMTEAASAYAGGAVVAVGSGRVERPDSRWPARIAVAPVVATLIAGTLFYVALPTGLGGGGLARTLIHHVTSTTNDSESTRDTAGIDTSGTGDLSLLVRGPLPDTPILRVPLKSPSLWRGTIYSSYTGTSWQAPFNETPQFTRQGQSAVPSNAADPVPVGSTHTYTEKYVGTSGDALVWAPGVPLAIHQLNQPIRVIVRDDHSVRVLGAGPTPTYRVTTAVPTTSAHRLTAATGTDLADPQWTRLPPELPAAVSTLAHQITSAAQDRRQQVTTLENYLRVHETYSLNSPVPGSGQDAVYDFLFRDHVGFCEQFASAEAVMLRTLGVPARVVSGLAYGIKSGKTRLYTGANAHAWVEVYYPGIGWSPTDPTAGVQLAPAPPANRSILRRILNTLTSIPGGTTALVSILVLAALAVMFIGRASPLGGRRGRRGNGRQPRSPIGPVLAAFNKVAANPRSPQPRQESETAREYLDRVGEPDTLGPTIETLEQEVYGATGPTDREVEAAVGELERLAHRTPVSRSS